MYNFFIKRLLKYIWIILFNLILILYLSELLITVFFKPKADLYLDIGYQRFLKAQELGVDFDTRTFYQAFYEEKKKYPDLSPKYRFSKTHYGTTIYGAENPIKKFMEKKINSGSLIPFRGPINKKTLSCNEEGIRRIINNDKYGFKNSNKIYEKKIEIFLIGDSFTQGVCQNGENDISGFLLNNYNINTANYGIGGTGPLANLATLKEYGFYFKPKFVIYLYYEGNDMQDLKDEQKTFLINYLGDFKQNLLEKNDEVNSFLDDYEKEAYKIFEKQFQSEYNKFSTNIYKELKKSKKRKLIEKLKDFFELQKTKNIFLSKSFYDQNNNRIDEKLFVKILNEMDNETKKWNGKLLIAYIPAWNRFNQKYSFVNFFHRNKIENLVKKTNIPYIDLIEEFEKTKQPIKLYPFGLRGHFTAEGYSLVAKSIFDRISVYRNNN